MKVYLLLTFLISLLLNMPGICKGQDFEVAYVDLLKKELRGLPCKDLTVSYTLSFDSLQNRYRFLAPQLHMDAVASAKLTNRLNALSGTTTKSYHGAIHFDNYTEEIFIRSEAEDADKIFISVEILAEPRGGIDRFVRRWGSFLDSLKKIGEFDDRNVSLGKYVYLVVEMDGSLVCPDTSEIATFLRRFIRKEKPWSPGIMSGRPVLQRVEMQVPSSGADYAALRYRRHRGLRGPIAVNNEEKILYYEERMPKQEGVRTVLSVVYENHRYVSPVFHKGPLDELKRMIAFLEERNVRASYHNPNFNRVYFYTMDD